MTVHRLALLLLLISCVAAALTPAFAYDTTERVSVSSGEAEGNGVSRDPSVSANGRYVAFQSGASNLVADDTNEVPDIFVRDRLTGETERVSINSAGEEGDDESRYPAISADGRYVAFQSFATNLVPDDTNDQGDIFVFDRETDDTERVSVSSSEVQGNECSPCLCSISSDGRYVAFQSVATNLVEGDTNQSQDVFVRDREAGTTERVSVSSAGAEGNQYSQAPSISADGRYVAFWSVATNLVEGDTNESRDVFVRDREAGTTERVSLGSAEEQGNAGSWLPSIDADGRCVAFVSWAENLVADDTNQARDVFLRDRLAGVTERVSLTAAGAEGNGDSYCPSISADARYVSFESLATNLVPGDSNTVHDVFVRDRQTGGNTYRVSVSSADEEGNDLSWSWSAAISAAGSCVAFFSDATNLVADDANQSTDVFVRGPIPGGTASKVLLEVHPNERAPGVATTQYLGKSPWTQPTSTPAANYWWKTYEFAAHGPLWIQLCAQNWSSAQKAYAANDRTKLQVNGLVPTDYDLIQSGTPGSWQWLGKTDQGKRVTLRFLAPVAPGKQALWIGAAESPVLWWLKVIDLEPDLIGPME